VTEINVLFIRRDREAFGDLIPARLTNLPASARQLRENRHRNGTPMALTR
jgi:hypothetical protein